MRKKKSQISWQTNDSIQTLKTFKQSVFSLVFYGLKYVIVNSLAAIVLIEENFPTKTVTSMQTLKNYKIYLYPYLSELLISGII